MGQSSSRARKGHERQRGSALPNREEGIPADSSTAGEGRRDRSLTGGTGTAEMMVFTLSWPAADLSGDRWQSLKFQFSTSTSRPSGAGCRHFPRPPRTAARTPCEAANGGPKKPVSPIGKFRQCNTKVTKDLPGMLPLDYARHSGGTASGGASPPHTPACFADTVRVPFVS
jgi:hypothetical protein